MKSTLFSIGIVIACILPPFQESVIPQILVITAILAFIFKSNYLKSFGIAFGIASLSWFFYTSYLNIGTELNSKVGEIFKGISVTYLKEISGVIAGITSGIGAMLGASIRALIPSNTLSS